MKNSPKKPKVTELPEEIQFDEETWAYMNEPEELEGTWVNFKRVDEENSELEELNFDEDYDN